jgi:2-polyprenyl-3-methyl-5-hydroxy-6-metoxy-1,4-benzoquinol methylase
MARRIARVIFRSYGRIWDLHILTEGIKTIRTIAEDEKDFDLLGKRDANHLRKFIEPDSIVLDIGCGIGRIEKYLASHCKEIHGVDASRVMIHRAKKRLEAYQNVFFYKTNGRDLSIF